MCNGYNYNTNKILFDVEGENGGILIPKIISLTDIEMLNIKINDLRIRRGIECFPIINRGQLWYDTLTAEQTEELNTWYHAWLDVTETKVIPPKPSFI